MSAFGEITVTDAEPLPPLESRLVGLIAEAPATNQEDMAAALRISTRHLRRLLAQERVRVALDRAARDGLREASNLLGRGAVQAARALVKMPGGELPPSPARVAAARAVIDGATRMIDIIDLERRVVELEHDRERPPAWRNPPMTHVKRLGHRARTMLERSHAIAAPRSREMSPAQQQAFLREVAAGIEAERDRRRAGTALPPTRASLIHLVYRWAGHYDADDPPTSGRSSSPGRRGPSWRLAAVTGSS